MKINFVKTVGWPALIALVLIVFVSSVVRFTSLAFPYSHPDEVISVKVAEMIASGNTLDTNWENADLPSVFKYPQYNFSGYLLGSAVVLKVAQLFPSFDSMSTLDLLRGASSALGVVVVFLIFLVGKQFFGMSVGLCAAFLGAVSPLLYQDSLYARPETFVTALSLLFVYVAGSFTLINFKSLFLASFVLGVLIATKISMLAMLPVLLLPVDRDGGEVGFFNYIKRSFLGVAESLKVIPFGIVLGFFAAAPFALINFEKFVGGFLALNSQYTTGHWPHGLPDADYFGRIEYAAGYFFNTSGVLIFLFSLAGAYWAFRKGFYRPFFVFLLFAVFFIRFGTYSTFFERNFSHVFPFFTIFAAFGLVRSIELLSVGHFLKPLIALGGLFVTAFPSLETTLKLRLVELPGKSSEAVVALRNGFEFELGVNSIQVGFVKDYVTLEDKIADNCHPSLIEFPYPGDERSMGVIHDLKELDGYKEVGRFTSIFSEVPTSTLHTYFTPTTVFLFRDANSAACENKGDITVSKLNVGDAIEAASINADLAWTKSGGYGGLVDPFGGYDYFGSWSGADSHAGRLSFEVQNNSDDMIVLPYMTGPVYINQSIVVRDFFSGEVIWSKKPLDHSPGWRFALISMPLHTRKIVVEAVDNGSDWGEWHAVAFPRAVNLAP